MDKILMTHQGNPGLKKWLKLAEQNIQQYPADEAFLRLRAMALAEAGQLEESFNLWQTIALTTRTPDGCADLFAAQLASETQRHSLVSFHLDRAFAKGGEHLRQQAFKMEGLQHMWGFITLWMPRDFNASRN